MKEYPGLFSVLHSEEVRSLRPQSLILVLTILILTGVVSGCGGKAKPGTAEVKRPPVAGVTIAAVQPMKAKQFYETSGTIKAASVSAISSKSMGTGTAILAKEGDRVNAGQVLALLEDRDLAARAAAAQAGYREALQAVEVAAEKARLAGITFDRYEQLYLDKAISRQEMDQQATGKRVAQLELDRARAGAVRAEAESQVYRSMTEITAPTAGIVTAKNIDLGSTAVPGIALFTVEDVSAFTFEAYVEESLASTLRPGMAAEIVIDALGKVLSGTITETAPAVDPVSRKFHVKLTVAAEGLKSGLYGKLRAPTGEKEALTVPGAAVVTKGQLTGVYVVDDDRVVTYRLVRAGAMHSGAVEILSGLTAGEKIIVGGVERAVDGGILSEVKSQ